MNKPDFDRRSFFKMTLTALAVAPVLFKSTKAEANAKCGVPPKGKQIAEEGKGMAKSLDYVVDATKSKNAKYAKGQDCGNCKYFNDKKLESAHAPCTMLGMRYVTTCGWCKSYLKK